MILVQCNHKSFTLIHSSLVSKCVHDIFEVFFLNEKIFLHRLKCRCPYQARGMDFCKCNRLLP